MKSMIDEIIMTTTPAITQGRRRPQRVRVRSLQRPMKGSMTTSASRASIITMPTAARSRPSVPE